MADRGYGWIHASPAKLADPVIGQLIDKVTVDPNPQPYPDRFPHHHGATVTITLKDGRQFSDHVDFPRGSAPRGIEWADADAKYRRLVPLSRLGAGKGRGQPQDGARVRNDQGHVGTHSPAELREELQRTTAATKDALIESLDRAAQDTLAYFAGPGRTTSARVDQWHTRDVLMHFIYFHNATAWGIQSATLGGPPWPLAADADHINEVCRRLHADESFEDLLSQLRLAHARLMRAARSTPDLETPCFRRPNGETVTVRQRLEVLARHWTEHVHALREAASKL